MLNKKVIVVLLLSAFALFALIYGGIQTNKQYKEMYKLQHGIVK